MSFFAGKQTNAEQVKMPENIPERRKLTTTKRFRRIASVVLATTGLGLWLWAGVAYSAKRSDSDGYLGDGWKKAAQENSAPERVGFVLASFEGSGAEKAGGLRESFKGQEDLIREVSGAAYVDTLLVLFGAPGIKVVESTDSLRAHYDRALDRITLNSNHIKSRMVLRGWLTHELAHAWQARQGDVIGQIWEEHGIRAPAVKMANYASYSKSEHQADAIAAAIGFIEVLGAAKIPDKIKIELARHLDEVAPGTMVMTRIFLGHPVFEYHAARQKRLAGIDLTPLDPPVAWRTERVSGEYSRLGQEMASVASGPVGKGLRKVVRAGRLNGS